MRSGHEFFLNVVDYWQVFEKRLKGLFLLSTGTRISSSDCLILIKNKTDKLYFVKLMRAIFSFSKCK
jgi:hypothetical protein